jgi:metal-responsive CopG/Arc/MetJ family transcriptional regulator
MQNFHVPLPEDLYAELRDAAKQDGRPATELTREWVREGLEQRQRMHRQAAILAFAQQSAGTDLDLDTDLETAGLEAIEEISES